MLSACVDASGLRAAGSARLALDELAGAGVADDPARGAVVLLLDRVDAGAVTRVRERSAGGVDRLVAVVATRFQGDTPWSLLRAGASDVLPLAPGWADAVARRLERWEAVDELVDGPVVRGALVGTSPAWRSALRLAVEAGRFTSAPMLITGESGTGKELIARLVHGLDPRPDRRDLVLLDCTTVVPTLSGSEFFGHERGAFTGAVSARDGAFAAAHAGTLFLDEIGELSAVLQAELLRVVQEGTYKRVGGNVWQRTRFRLICATNRDLSVERAEGRFRSDLYFRIAGAVVHLPPLRHRRSDVVPLFRFFLGQLREGGSAPDLDPSVVELLYDRAYPGNARDLRQLAARVLARHVGDGPITPGDVPVQDWPQAPAGPAQPFDEAVEWALVHGMTYADIRDTATSTALRLTLEATEGNAQAAAARLGVTDRTVQKFQADRRSDAMVVPRQRT